MFFIAFSRPSTGIQKPFKAWEMVLETALEYSQMKKKILVFIREGRYWQYTIHMVINAKRTLSVWLMMGMITRMQFGENIYTV